MEATAATCDVEATDVVRVVLQFLKENGLTNAMLALQDESQVALNTVDNLDTFVHDVQQGHWESVMTTVATLKLPMGLLSDLYEQVNRAHEAPRPHSPSLVAPQPAPVLWRCGRWCSSCWRCVSWTPRGRSCARPRRWWR